MVRQRMPMYRGLRIYGLAYSLNNKPLSGFNKKLYSGDVSQVT
jgi:hypothetical protein